MNIVVLEGNANTPGDLSWAGLEPFGTVTVHDYTPQINLAEQVAEADIVVASKIAWNAETFPLAPHLKMLSITSTGYDVINLEEARKHHVVVSNVPAYSTPDVAQMTFALLLELCMHAGRNSDTVMHGDWINDDNFPFWDRSLVELAGKRMGVVGMGSIGCAVARIARAFDMDVVFSNHRPKPQAETDGIRQVELDELLRTSDIISLHVPASPTTERMINAATLARMKDGAFLLNTARGTLVDEQAVVDALHSGKLGGFGADVAAVEPMSPDCPFLELQDANAVITPHIAWATHEARQRLLNVTAANVGAFVAGHPQNVVS